MVARLHFVVLLVLVAQLLYAQKIKSLSVCAGGNVSITVPYSANNSYQWQVKTINEGSYNNLTNSPLYTGVNSSNLFINNAPTSMVGYNYRCLITAQAVTSNSDITVLKFKAVWTGNTDSIWNKSGNWSCGVVPDENTEILLQPGAPYYPYINFNVTCRKLSLGSNAYLKLRQGFNIIITGKDSLPSQSKSPQKTLVDSTATVLLSDETEMETGLFRYNKLPGNRNMSDGDFLIEPRNYGYLRKVELIDSNSNGVSIYTSQGTMSELYKDSAAFNQTFIIPDTKNPFSEGGTGLNQVNGPSQQAMQVPEFSVAIPNGSIKFTNFLLKFNPNPTFNFSIKDEYLKAGFVNTTYGFSFDAGITLQLDNNTDPPEDLEFDITDKIPAIKALKLPFAVGFLMGHMEFHVILRAKGKVSTSLQQTLHYDYTATRNAYIETVSGTPIPVFNTGVPVTNFVPSTREWQLNAELGLEVDLLPKIFLYKIPVVNLGISGSIDLKSAVNLDSKAWDANLSFVVGGKANTDKTLFHFMRKVDYTIPFFDPKILWKAPSQLNIVSGATQTAKINTALPQPIVLQVLEDFGFKVPLVKVFFSSNLGNWENATVITDIEGKVSNKFTFGNTTEDHLLTAIIKKADNSNIDTVYITLKPGSPPVVSTTAVSAIGETTAATGGGVSAEGGSPVISRGVCWNILSNPTVFNSKTVNGNGPGSFTSNISSLLANTSYHVRAYAINNTDTAYGADVLFKTMSVSDTVTTLIAHGVWKAISGFGFDGLTTVHPTDNECGASLDQFGKTDSLHMLFNANKTGLYLQWNHEWGDSMNSNCEVNHYDYFYPRNYSFTWEYVRETGTIAILFNAEEFYAFDILEGEVANFKIQLFNNGKMDLLLDGAPWGYEGLAWQALFE